MNTSSASATPETPKGGCPRLILPGSVDAGGTLVFDHVRLGDRPLAVKLEGRHVRVLLVLYRRWCRLLDADAVLRPGYVRAELIAAEYYGEDELAARPDAQAIRAYLSQINRRIREAMPGVKAPVLHRSHRHLGYRLEGGLEVVTREANWAPP